MFLLSRIRDGISNDDEVMAGIAEAFEERFLAFQHVLVIVDAKDDCALECRRNRRGHGSPSKQFSTLRLRKPFKIAQTALFASPAPNGNGRKAGANA
jgi:hypothetical protein